MAALYVIKWFSWSEKPQHTANWKVLHDPTKNDGDETQLYRIAKNYQVVEPVLRMVMNEPGELSFTVPPTHYFYDRLKSAGISICVAVFRNGSFLWGGHPLTVDEDLYGNLTYSCEGVLGWLSDVIAPTFGKSVPVKTWLNWFVNGYYRWGTSGVSVEDEISDAVCYRLFASCDVDWTSITLNDGSTVFSGTTNVERSTGKNLTVLELLKTRLLDYFGGYFKVGLAEEELDDLDDAKGIWTLAYKSDPAASGVHLNVGENIQSLTRTTDYTDFCTALVVTDSEQNCLLSEDMETEACDYEGAFSGCYKLANSPMIIHRELSEKYGLIAKYVEAETSDDLSSGAYLSEALTAVNALTEPESTVEVEATDTALVTGNFFHVGGTVTYTDAARNEYANMVIEELELNLDDPSSNTITLNGALKTLSGKVK